MGRGGTIVLVISALAGCLVAPSCSDETSQSTTTNPCPQGICGTTSSSSSGGGGESSSSSSGSSGSGSSSSSSGGGCVEAWRCTPWQTNGNDNNGTRTCTDLNNCGTTNNKPAETATLPALDFDYYKCNVEPIFDRGCAMLGCHGKETERALRIYARGRLRITGDTLIEPDCLMAGTMKPSESCIGSIECACWTVPHTTNEWRRNFDAARGFGLDAAGNPIPAGNEDTSDLIAQPIVGGKAHAGVHLFKDGDPDHTTLKNWLKGTKLGMACTTTN